MGPSIAATAAGGGGGQGRARVGYAERSRVISGRVGPHAVVKVTGEVGQGQGWLRRESGSFLVGWGRGRKRPSASHISRVWVTVITNDRKW